MKSDFFDYDVKAILKKLKKVLGKRQWDIAIFSIDELGDEKQQELLQAPIAYKISHELKQATIVVNTLHEDCIDIVGQNKYTGWLYQIMRVIVTLEIQEYSKLYSLQSVDRDLLQMAWGIVILMKELTFVEYLNEKPQ